MTTDRKLLFGKVLVAIDNSPFSEPCSSAAVSLARESGGAVTGIHVYAGRMHERRFHQMEATLPEKYLDDDELERQRTIHNSLIGLGLKLISDCYLDRLEEMCRADEIPFTRKTLDGKNWERLAEEINTSSYDLVVMGARGHGTAESNGLGSVCLRTLRHTRTNTLVLKNPAAFNNGAGGNIVVALDGSEEAFGGLLLAVAIGKAFDRTVEAVAAFDPYFHYEVFSSLVEVLSPGAAKVFRFKEQERLHEEIIDTGLARLYRTHLDIAERLAAEHGVKLETRLLTGRAADEVAEYVRSSDPWLVVTGRIGVHSGEDMDIGSLTEHLLRFVSCNVLVASQRFAPPFDLIGEVAVRWTEDADIILKRTPAEFRGAMRLMVHKLAIEQGHTVVTASLVQQAMALLHPRPDGMERMGAAATAVAVDALTKDGDTVYLCRSCGHATRRVRPTECPACGAGGGTFLAVTPEELEAQVAAEGGSHDGKSFDGRTVRWSDAAMRWVEEIDDRLRRTRARQRIEKASRRASLPVITLDFARDHASTRQGARSKSAPRSRPNMTIERKSKST